MTGFDDREKAFEKKFALDEEISFKATARRNRLIGLWLAGLMSYTQQEADEYAKTVVAADFEAAGDDDVVKKLVTDAAAAGLTVSEPDIRAKMEALFQEAIKQLSA